jgi:hypothetical protein
VAKSEPATIAYLRKRLKSLRAGESRLRNLKPELRSRWSEGNLRWIRSEIATLRRLLGQVTNGTDGAGEQ